jgi:hypothetical protein
MKTVKIKCLDDFNNKLLLINFTVSHNLKAKQGAIDRMRISNCQQCRVSSLIYHDDTSETPGAIKEQVNTQKAGLLRGTFV